MFKVRGNDTLLVVNHIDVINGGRGYLSQQKLQQQIDIRHGSRYRTDALMHNQDRIDLLMHTYMQLHLARLLLIAIDDFKLTLITPKTQQP